MYTMKKVLLLDASPLFRDFLKEKLTAESVSVEAVENSREAFSTLVTQLPDLIVLDVDNGKTIEDYLGFLNDKHNDPNTRAIPVIVAGPTIERERISALTKYGIVKYFGKPIKFDLFFDSVGKILHANFSIDTTPSLMEIHLNDDIIFVEMARGLNREKLIMLKYHLSEIIDTNKLANPKLIIMMTDLQLSFVDGSNLELLFDSVVADPRINSNNIKVLIAIFSINHLSSLNINYCIFSIHEFLHLQQVFCTLTFERSIFTEHKAFPITFFYIL